LEEVKINLPGDRKSFYIVAIEPDRKQSKKPIAGWGKIYI